MAGTKTREPAVDGKASSRQVRTKKAKVTDGSPGVKKKNKKTAASRRTKAASAPSAGNSRAMADIEERLQRFQRELASKQDLSELRERIGRETEGTASLPTGGSAAAEASADSGIDAVFNLCRLSIGEYEKMVEMWGASPKPTPTFAWTEDTEAIGSVVRLGFHRGRTMLASFMTPGKQQQDPKSQSLAAADGGASQAGLPPEPAREASAHAHGVEALVNSVFAGCSQEGNPTWGALVGEQVQGLGMFMRAGSRS